MAAALRLQAAARMLQRSPAEQRLRLLPRLLHGAGSPSTPSAAAERLSLVQLHDRQQELSEELYPVLLELDKRILGKHHKATGLIFHTRYSDLLGIVTKHVDPRPNDSNWRWFRAKVILSNGCAWLVGLGFLHCMCFHDLLAEEEEENDVDKEE
ncbi:uncharacterized protein LOC119356984 [Triticum dicoccoides]|uniref:uncharacterized protein LOC119356957 n=1 Tax=Triticum dicoccoides TaxID=85692 RepID=UPI00162BEEED|nr:uncharacterized protein LOC119356957 [Triticum dicoccoides]XP_037479868.1 uncharacterized protein LOC119356984 [Triticum dicoccoides]